MRMTAFTFIAVLAICASDAPSRCRHRMAQSVLQSIALIPHRPLA